MLSQQLWCKKKDIIYFFSRNHIVNSYIPSTNYIFKLKIYFAFVEKQFSQDNKSHFNTS